MRIGLVWRVEWDPPASEGPIASQCKLRGVFAALAELGVQAEPVVYSDSTSTSVREQLLELDGVLVWVNPIEHGLDRSRLDPLLRDVAAHGVFVSAHPDVILRMGTKEVLVETRSMDWGTDARIYPTLDELRSGLPARLAAAGPLVLKQHRGMGGMGVWKVELLADGRVLAQHAADAAAPDVLSMDELLARLGPYVGGTGPMVEQPYLPRVADGMIRAYLVHDRVVGFTHQYPRGLLPVDAEPRPATKLFEPPETPKYDALRRRLEGEWVREMQRILSIPTDALPVIWDADFFLGPSDSFVLCEINVSSTFAFPEFAMPAVAAAAIERVRAAS